MLEAHGFGVRHIYRISQLLFFSALCLWVLDIGSRIFGLQFLRTTVTGGGSSLQTELLLIPLFVAVYALPALRRKKLPRVCAALTLAYSALIPMLSMDVVVELWLAEETHSYGLWTAHSTFLSMALISISILLLQTKLQILGATVAFVASITPLHLVLTYILAPGYLDHHTPMSTALILVLLSAAVLLRFCTRSTFRKFFTRSIRSLNLISVGLLGIVIQQSLVLFDLYRGIDTNDLELLIVSLPLQYLLFSYVNNQVNSYRSIVKYGKRMHRNATLDPLTKCGNRQSLKEVLSGLEQDKYRGIGVLMFDIDHFKSVNDKYGHDTGDQVLRELAATVRRGIGPAQWFIRWGGEEFIVIAAGADLQALESLAESLRERVEAEKFSTVGNITISLGGAVGEVSNFYDLVAAADMALYESKKKGRNKATLADEVFLNQQMLSGASVTAEQVRSAIVDRQLFFVGQPVIDVKENRVVALEALLRWRRADGEILVPTQFIDKLNQIVLLEAGLYELLTHCKVEYLMSIRDQYPDAAVAFNVTIDELNSSSCNSVISELLDCATSLERQLIFELSEGSVSDSVDIESINKIIRRYREGGVRIAIDDFGTGSNNLRNLMQLEVDIVKLAPSIAAAIDSGQKPLKVLSSLNLMMHNLKVEIYIEGIDTELQSRLLRGLGYKYQQGYHIGSGEQKGPVRH